MIGSAQPTALGSQDSLNDARPRLFGKLMASVDKTKLHRSGRLGVKEDPIGLPLMMRTYV